MLTFATLITAAERGQLPDAAIRLGIRRLLAQRARAAASLDCETAQARIQGFVDDCREAPVALVPEKANEQHYEVPAAFFERVLGPQLKYSCCLWGPGIESLHDAEVASLNQTCVRARLVDGQSILELGCGWGSLTLCMAAAYPHSRITAVSNSHSQREFILERARQRGLTNVEVITADIGQFRPTETYDRVVSVEMFEHVRNHAELLRRISEWLVPGGFLFVHHFSHRELPYLFEDSGPQDWMTRFFFSGGMMPHDGLLLNYQDHLRVRHRWCWSGTHYQRTCEEWLKRCDRQTADLLPLFEATYGRGQGRLWLQRWRMFFMACAELFGYRRGNEWWVTHTLLENP